MEEQWKAKQNEIAQSVKVSDENWWHDDVDEHGYHGKRPLFVAGVDISFSMTDAHESIGTLTIVRLNGDGVTVKRELCLSKSRRVQVTAPYKAGYLGFREAPVVSELLKGLDSEIRKKIDCILLDGNGILHPRKAGLACHVGVEHDMVAIGVSKSLLCVDGLSESEVKREIGKRRNGDMDIVGRSGTVWGRALITGNAINKPIYVSVGHKVSLQCAARLVKTLCTFRVPDPIRYADLHSRAVLRGEAVHVFRAKLFDTEPP